MTADEQLVESLAESERADRYVDPRTVPVRFSNLKHMAASALHYLDAVQTDRDDTIAMRFGRGTHALIFGQPVVKWDGKTRNGKVWDAFKATNAHAEIMNVKEWAAAESIASALRNHSLAAPLLFDHGAVHEEQIAWEWLGRACTSRLDMHRPGVLVDLKTTKCADPVRFERDAYWRGYHAQLAFYSLAYRHKYGESPAASYIVAVESKRPHAIVVMHVPPAALEVGEMQCRGWFERLLACEASNAWPGYSESVVEFRLPSEASPPNITIDGEEVDFDAA